MYNYDSTVLIFEQRFKKLKKIIFSDLQHIGWESLLCKMLPAVGDWWSMCTSMYKRYVCTTESALNESCNF